MFQKRKMILWIIEGIIITRIVLDIMGLIERRTVSFIENASQTAG